MTPGPRAERWLLQRERGNKEDDRNNERHDPKMGFKGSSESLPRSQLDSISSNQLCAHRVSPPCRAGGHLWVPCQAPASLHQEFPPGETQTMLADEENPKPQSPQAEGLCHAIHIPHFIHPYSTAKKKAPVPWD